jgi:DNA-binding NarL/FixJ family response regulator
LIAEKNPLAVLLKQCFGMGDVMKVESNVQGQTMPQVLLVEDDPVAGKLTRTLIERESVEVLGPIANGQQALELASLHRPILAVVDIGLEGDLTGIDLAHALTELGLKIVFLTGHNDPDVMNTALALKPHSYLVKPGATKEIAAYVRAAIADINSTKPPRPPVAEASLESAATFTNMPGLTPRLREVLSLMAQRLSSKEIAAQLGLSVHTVRSYEKEIFTLLDVHNRRDTLDVVNRFS